MRKSKFTMDIGWKLLSLIIAIGLWFMVINTENPVETRSYTAAIQLQNEEALTERGYVVVNDDELSSTRVTVRLRGQRLALDALSQSSTRVQAVVDLSDVIYSYSGEPVSVPVDIVIPSVVNSSFEILSKSVQTVSVDIQPYVNKDFDVKAVVNTTDETAKELANAVASPGSVTVYGARSIVESVAEVRAYVSPETVEDGMVMTAVPVAYNADGVVVGDVTFGTEELSVMITLDEVKSVRVNLSLTGEVADGYEITDYYTTPETMEVAGDAAALSRLNSINLPDIDVTGLEANSGYEFSAGDYLPDGLRALDGGRITATVIVEEEETKELIIPVESVTWGDTLAEGYMASISGEDISISVKGVASVIDTLTAADVEAHIDLDGLEEGEHDDVYVRFELPEGVSLAGGGGTVNVFITQVEEKI